MPGIEHDDVIKWKHFPHNWPFVRGIHRSPVNSPHKGQWCGALMISLICVLINDWVNNREAGDLRRYRAHYDVIVMTSIRGWTRKRHPIACPTGIQEKSYHAITALHCITYNTTLMEVQHWSLFDLRIDTLISHPYNKPEMPRISPSQVTDSQKWFEDWIKNL